MRQPYLSGFPPESPGSSSSQGQRANCSPVTGSIQIFPSATYSAMAGLNNSQPSMSSAVADKPPSLYARQHLPHWLQSFILSPANSGGTVHPAAEHFSNGCSDQDAISSMANSNTLAPASE